MKRLGVRLSLVGVLLASGILAIAQAQRGPSTPKDGEQLAQNDGADAAGGDASQRMASPVLDPTSDSPGAQFGAGLAAPDYSSDYQGGAGDLGPPQVRITEENGAPYSPPGYGAEHPAAHYEIPGDGQPGAEDPGVPGAYAMPGDPTAGSTGAPPPTTYDAADLPPAPQEGYGAQGAYGAQDQGAEQPSYAPPYADQVPDGAAAPTGIAGVESEGPSNLPPVVAAPSRLRPVGAGPESIAEGRAALVDDASAGAPGAEPYGLPSQDAGAGQGGAGLGVAGDTGLADQGPPSDLAPAAPYEPPALPDSSYDQGQLDGRGQLGAGQFAGAADAGSGDEMAPLVAPANGGAPQPLDTPGDPKLDGRQAPAITLEKRAPQEIRINQPAVFELVVRNNGQSTAQDVLVLDRIPLGTEFVDATPQPQQLEDGALAWQFATLAPGEERTVSMRLMPRQEGEIGSVAVVVVQSQAGVRTVCTRPQLSIKQRVPESVLIGQPVRIGIQISNPGTGAAENVILEADVPPGLVHPQGNALKYVVGALAPNETRDVVLELTAEQPGVVQSVVRLSGDGGLQANDSQPIEVVAPQLALQLTGPSVRYLGREATYQLTLENPGTATARSLEAVVYLPDGMEFLGATHQGRYQQQNHAVYWRLEELAPNQTGEVQLRARPVDSGSQKLRAEARASLGLAQSVEHETTVQTLNELVFTVADDADPIEVDAETTYEIRVVNNGAQPDANVEVVVQLPAELEFLGADGATQPTRQGALIRFEPVARLAPNAQAVFHIKARGTTVGDHRVQVQVRSQESPTPVTKEEVTRVYADR